MIAMTVMFAEKTSSYVHGSRPEISEAAQTLLDELLPLRDPFHAAWLRGNAYEMVERSLTRCLAKLSATNLVGMDNRLPSSDIWNIAGDNLGVGWLQNRARIKPRGYAGDFEMQQRVYDRQLCDHPFGRLFDRYFQNQAAPQAVRNRMQLVANWIVERVRTTQRPCRVVSFGSGPGLDVRDALARLSAQERELLTITLLDLDPLGLEFAAQQIAPYVQPHQLHCADENLFRLAKNERLARKLADADLIFCTGLFDYLDDAGAAAMLAAMYRKLAPGGQVTFFNFSPENPTRAYMEWLGNWYLIYREPQQMWDIAEAAGIPTANCTVGVEAVGINLYLTATKRSP